MSESIEITAESLNPTRETKTVDPVVAAGIARRIAAELTCRPEQVSAAVGLLDEGSTVPFIARYRKEVTGGLDDAQLRTLEERLGYLREMEDRRAAILKSVADQDKLTPELEKQLKEADSKARLEDLYLPFKPKRRTKAQIAREAGLEPLADGLLTDPSRDPEAEAAGFVDAEKGVADVKAALDGARQILMERFAEDPELVGGLREAVWSEGWVSSRVVDGKQEAGAKFSDYFDFAEAISKVPSHRALALFRGQREEVLSLTLHPGRPDDDQAVASMIGRIARRFGIVEAGRPADKWLADTAAWTWKVKLSLHLQLDLMGRLRGEAEDEAIRVFAGNLRDLLLAAPAGPRPTLALDPGYRTGVKVAVTDATGKVVETATIYPHEPKRQWDESIRTLAVLCDRHKVELIAIGNGTASRETDKLAGELIGKFPDAKLTKVMVSEAGASVYSASAFASRELPELDVSLRGAVSIARRLQDPLAELVKIDPKSIGVGQYQHDVSPAKLGKSLDAVVEDCVNAVGVDVNTASAPLLARVAGLGERLAETVVSYRDANGAFASREALKQVPRLGPMAFQQAAGFLRIRGGSNPLDQSAVHPESYPLVERILASLGQSIEVVMGDGSALRGVDAKALADEAFGLPTVRDVLSELEKPGRDPRPAFKTAEFKEGVETLSDLRPGMVLEGTVTNVTNFGAFVDIGVHQDGLVHVSAMSKTFVKDPRAVVTTGDVVTVKVLEVDLKRKRVGLTLRLDDPVGVSGETPQRQALGSGRGTGGAGNRGAGDRGPGGAGKGGKGGKSAPPPSGSGALAEAFARAQKNRK